MPARDDTLSWARHATRRSMGLFFDLEGRGPPIDPGRGRPGPGSKHGMATSETQPKCDLSRAPALAKSEKHPIDTPPIDTPPW